MKELDRTKIYMLYDGPPDMKGDTVIGVIYDFEFSGNNGGNAFECVTEDLGTAVPEFHDYEIGLFVHADFGGPHMAVDNTSTVPDPVVERIQDWLHEKVELMSIEDFITLIREQIPVRIKENVRTDNIKSMLAALDRSDALEECGDPCYHLDNLVDDRHGVYMFENFMQSIGVDIPNDMHTYEHWCELTDEWLRLVSDSIDIPGVYVEFDDGGLSLMYSGDLPEEEKNDDILQKQKD